MYEWDVALARLLVAAERLSPPALLRLAAFGESERRNVRAARKRATTIARRLGRQPKLTEAQRALESLLRPAGAGRLDGAQFADFGASYAWGADWQDLVSLRSAVLPLLLDAATAIVARDGLGDDDFDRLYGPFRRAMAPAWRQPAD